MPWDGTECHLAQLDDAGAVISQQLIAGAANESVFQPQWSPAGELFFVSDRSNWWNLYRWNGRSAEALCPMAAEFAAPQWTFGMSTYGFIDADRVLCCYSQSGQWYLASIALATGNFTPIETALTDISALNCAGRTAVFLGADPVHSPALWRYTPDAHPQLQQTVQSSAQVIPVNYLSQPMAIGFPTTDGETAHGFYYPPHNPDFCGPEGVLPPLLVMCHGGPTGATEASLNLKIQYWTSRGFAVLDVNYRGSTGYGRPYRERLKRNWGITDVVDVCSGVDYLVQRGLAHPRQVAIRGSSAGGYTVLAALTFSDRFQAGASLYGIGDLETLARDTHKFESRYLDTLVGSYPAERDTYRDRSPIHHSEQLHCPVIFLQGLQDRIVPPEQAEAMVSALTEKSIPNAYVTFPEEAHGFRQAQNIQRAIEAELYFYGKVFGFKPADELAPLVINHLPEESTP
jgi:dipeptidyl aminopeptidase/acylaminoacyl peptidase